jgi:hypothetical protein
MGKTASCFRSNEFKGNSLPRRVSWYPVVNVLIIPGRRDIEVRSGQDRDVEVRSGQDRDIEATLPDYNNPPDRDIEVELSGENTEHTVYADTCAQPIPVKHTTTRRKSVTFSKMIEVFIIPSCVIGNGSGAFANPKPSTQNPQTYRKS